MKSQINKTVKKQLKPEFLNRLDGTVIFKTLDKEGLLQVIDLEIDKLKKRLKQKNITIELDDKAKEMLVDEGMLQPEMGARPLRRIIENKLEDPLAEKLLTEGDAPRHIGVTAKKDQLVFADQKVELSEEEPLAVTGASETDEGQVQKN